MPHSLPEHIEAPQPVIDEVQSSLDAIGQQNEIVRTRISHMMDRLDDIISLKHEFTEIIAPVATLITEYPHVQSKLMDVEATLKHERESGIALKRELRTVNAENTKLSDGLTSFTSLNQALSAKIRDQDAELDSLRLTTKNKELLVDDLERRIFSENERARALLDENQALRNETQEADRVIARFERDLAEARENIEMVEHDNESLRATTGEQVQRLAALESSTSELEQQFQAARQVLSEMEAKLNAEQSLRHRLEAQIEAERANARSDLARLGGKLEGVTSRMAVTEKILGHAREQLRERTEELKAAERIAKEAVIDRNTFERRLESAQQESNRYAAQSADSDKARFDLAERCEMLTKALSAKDSMIEKSEHRIQMLLDRIDQLSVRFEEERTALEAVNAKLVEDLNSERSERALAQGALETARKTRVEIHREFLKGRSRRSGTDDVDLGESGFLDVAPSRSEPAESNVRPFKNPDAN